MTKVICKPFPKPIGECIHNPHVDVIKTRKDGKDTYIYEVRADGVPKFVVNPEETYPAGNFPNLEDTWHGSQWPGKDCNGGDYDINLYDIGLYDESCGLGAVIYSCIQQGDYPTTNFDDSVKATVKCWFQDEKGKRTEFNYNIPDYYIEKFGEWDGTPIHLVKRPTDEVFKGAKEIADRLKKFLKKNKLELHYEMASDTVYMLPQKGWANTTKKAILEAMKASGKIINPRTYGTKWSWLRGSELDDNWFCKKEKEAKMAKKTLIDRMPSQEILAEGRQIVADLMQYLADNKLFLMFDPDDYILRLGPEGLCHCEGKPDPKRKIPYTKEEDEIWLDKFSLDVGWTEFDPENFDDDEED